MTLILNSMIILFENNATKIHKYKYILAHKIGFIKLSMG